MRRMLWLLSCMALIFVTSCNPKVSTQLSKSYTALDYKQEVVVINLNQSAPENAEIIGEIKVGDSGFSTNCGYDVVIEKAKMEARKAGGNAIKITGHRPPSALGSSCHRITANILKVENIENFVPQDEPEVLLDVDYAILNVYRYSGAGALVGYDLYLGDSVICRVKNNFKTTIHIKKDGMNTLWAKTEAKEEVPINITFGKTYYLHCGIGMGVMVGRPVLELVDSKTGKAEFDSFKAKNQ